MKEQNENSIIKSWMDKVVKNRGIDKDNIIRYCQKIYNYGKNTNSDFFMGFAQFYMGETYYILNDIEGLFLNSISSLNYLHRSAQWELLSMSYNLLAIAFSNQGNNSYALDYYITGINICKKNNLAYMEAVIMCNIGILHMNQEEYEGAIHFFQESLEGFCSLERNKEYYTHLTSVYMNFSRCFLELGKPDKAEYYMQLIESDFENHLDGISKQWLYCFKACYYHAKGDILHRNRYIQWVTENLSDDFVIFDVFDEFYYYGLMLLKCEKYNDFIKILNVFENITRKSELIYLQRRTLTLKLEYLKKIEDKQGYYEASAVYYELSKAMTKQEKYVIISMMENRLSLEASKRKRMEIEAEKTLLREKSEMDALTQIANRFSLNEYAEEAFKKAYENQTYLAIEILDVDYFKEYNDNYGHQAGDECLIKIAEEMKRLSREKRIFCARYGGDEFILLYEGYTLMEVLSKAKQLKERMKAIRMEHRYSKAELYVTLSQGICCDIPKDGNKVWDYLHNADIMLYKAKEKSRNSIAIGKCDGTEPVEYC